MNRFAVVAVIAIAAGVAYFVFAGDPYPDTVTFRGHTLGSKQDDNNSLKKELDIFSYRDETNHHVLLFVIRNDSDATVAEAAEQYLARFGAQGFVFDADGTRHLGVKSDEAIYMAETDAVEGLIVFIEKGRSPMPTEPSDASEIFDDLESFSFGM